MPTDPKPLKHNIWFNFVKTSNARFCIAKPKVTADNDWDPMNCTTSPTYAKGLCTGISVLQNLLGYIRDLQAKVLYAIFDNLTWADKDPCLKPCITNFTNMNQ